MEPFLSCQLAIDMAVGLITGLLVTKRHVSPFLATLATMILLQGFRFAYTQGAPSGTLPPLFRAPGSGKLICIPFNFAILLIPATLLWVSCIVRHWAAASLSWAAARSPGACGDQVRPDHDSMFV